MKQFILSTLLLLTLTAYAQVQLYNYKGVVGKVTDGDTFTVHAELGFDVFKDVIIRMASINAAEMKGTDSIAARKAKDYLTKRILGKTIWFTSRSYDKYHRSIAIVWLVPTGGESVNDEMVRKGYAVKQLYK